MGKEVEIVADIKSERQIRKEGERREREEKLSGARGRRPAT